MLLLWAAIACYVVPILSTGKLLLSLFHCCDCADSADSGSNRETLSRVLEQLTVLSRANPVSGIEATGRPQRVADEAPAARAAARVRGGQMNMKAPRRGRGRGRAAGTAVRLSFGPI